MLWYIYVEEVEMLMDDHVAQILARVVTYIARS